MVRQCASQKVTLKENKQKPNMHIDWSQGFRGGCLFLSWPWPRPWNVKVIYLISYKSGKMAQYMFSSNISMFVPTAQGITSTLSSRLQLIQCFAVYFRYSLLLVVMCGGDIISDSVAEIFCLIAFFAAQWSLRTQVNRSCWIYWVNWVLSVLGSGVPTHIL